MWVRKRLDIGWTDLFYGVWRAGLPGNRAAIRRKVEEEWSATGDALVCLSARSGWDLLLSAAEWPPGSEIAMSALTIPDMASLVRRHGLTPVPVDLDLDTAAPNFPALRRSITRATRAVLVAHLFGARVPMEPILAIAREHGLLVVEDCAQTYDGVMREGHPESDAALFSFGPIKTATALGGAVLRVRDAQLREKMRRRQAAYRTQRRRRFLVRLMKYALLKALSAPPVFGTLARGAGALGFDYDRLVNGSVRGFPGPALLDQIRQQPCAPLLALLHRRLRRYDRQRVDQRAALGRRLASLFEEQVFCPGAAAAIHTYWVFPILTDNPDEVIAALQDAGFDATQGQSMAAVSTPDDRPGLTPLCAIDALAQIVFLPVYPEMPQSELERMAGVVLKASRWPTPGHGGSLTRPPRLPTHR